jgi:hypothetical protein
LFTSQDKDDWQVAGEKRKKKKKKKNEKKKKCGGGAVAEPAAVDDTGSGGNDDDDDESDDDDDFIVRMAGSQKAPDTAAIRKMKNQPSESEVERTTREVETKEKMKKKMRQMEKARQERLKNTMDGLNASESSTADGGGGKEEEEEEDGDVAAPEEPKKVRVQDKNALPDLRIRMATLRKYCEVSDGKNEAMVTFVKLYREGEEMIKKSEWGKGIEKWRGAIDGGADKVDPRCTCTLSMALALLYKSIGEIRKAINYFAWAYDCVKNEKDVGVRTYPLEQLTELYRDVGQQEQANQVLALLNKLLHEATNQENIARLEKKRNKLGRWQDAVVKATRGDCEILKELVADGDIFRHIDVDQGTEDSNTALMAAAINGDLELATLLIEKSANLEVEDAAGQTALVYACTFKQVDMFKFLVRKQAQCPPIETLPEESVERWSSEIKGMYDKVSMLYKKRSEADAKKGALPAALQQAAAAAAAPAAPAAPAAQAPLQKQKQGKKGNKKGGDGDRGEKYDQLKGFNAAPPSKDAKSGKLFGRELASFDWSGGADDEGGAGLEDEDGGLGGGSGGAKNDTGEWDQFAANEKLFGVKSTYDENLYTTSLDKKKLTKEQIEEAQRIADAILGGDDTDNLHVKEERGHDMSQHSEEALYSAVLGSGGFDQAGKKEAEGTSARKQVTKQKGVASDGFTDSGVNFSK